VTWRAVAALGLGGCAYMVFESQWLRQVRRDVPIADLPPDLDGFTIVQLSDMHVGFRPSLNVRTLRKAVDAALAAAPDLIAITGDLATGNADLRALRGELSRLHAPGGVLAVLGNHDHGLTHAVHTPPAELGDLAHVGVRLLSNDCWTLTRGQARLQVCGIDDVRHGYADIERVEAQLDRSPGAVRLLLSHYGEGAARFARGAFALTLSGDTHGGQICLPWPGGRLMLSDPKAKYREGFHNQDGGLVYVTRGVGTSFLPFRLFCRPEIVIFRLRRADGATSAGSEGAAGLQEPTRPRAG